MFTFAILLGIYSYMLFIIGITGYFYKEAVALVSIIFFATIVIWFFNKEKVQIIRIPKVTNKLSLFLVILLLIQAVVNGVGVLGPELSFDALWYHLTLPKLYLLNHSIYHIPGGLLYYSDMPKLAEMLYAGALSLGNEITVKAIHFSFGILTSTALYLLSRKYFPPLIAVIAVVIFYSNIVVAWESTTAYVDLIRAFFEIMALWGFVSWQETKEKRWFYLSAIMVGLAITTKLLAIGTLIIFSLLLVASKIKSRQKYLKIIHFWFIALLVPLPWFIFSYIYTGNPVYPFFSPIYQISPEPLSFANAVSDLWIIFTRAADPISPLYLIFLPLVFVFYKNLDKPVQMISWYSLLAVIVWYFTPRTGGGRFLLPYLPAMSIVCAGVLSVIIKHERKKLYLGTFLIVIISLVAVITIGYRFFANSKYIPVLIGQQSKSEFLTNNLNFRFSDFYDTDNYFKDNIAKDERVLLFGFHNLYYVDFPFIDSTWVKPGDIFHYIAVQNAELPAKYRDWQLIYSNDKTMVKLYKHKSIKEHRYVYAL